MSGYDGLFDAGMHRLALKTSTLSRPKKWPTHVSAMRRHTSYQGQDAIDPLSSSWHSDFMVARAHPAEAPAAPYAGGLANRARAIQYRAALARAQAKHLAHAQHAAASRRAGLGAPAAAHVTDSRRWSWADARS